MLQNKSFGFCLLLLLLLFRTGLDCKMDGTEKGGARERNPLGSEFDPICQRNLSSAATSAIGPKKGNEEVARERNPIGGEFDPICQRNLSSAATSAIEPKRGNEEVESDANRQEIEGFVRTQRRVYSRRMVYPKTLEQLCETKEKKRDQQKAATV